MFNQPVEVSLTSRTEEAEIRYALEGSVFMGGAVVQWLRAELGIIQSAPEIQQLAMQVPDSGGVYFVPAFAGLGAPYWDPTARGMIIGLTRGTNRSHIARAALESTCFQSLEVFQAMEQDSGVSMKSLRVDGGASADHVLMQIQADLLQLPVERPKQIETTAFGAAALAGLETGFWSRTEAIGALLKIDRGFEPQIGSDEANARHTQWKRAVERCKGWENSS